MSPNINIAYCFTGVIGRGGGGLFFMYVSMYFKIMSNVVKYTCRLRRYNYTHDQLNTRHLNIIFLGIILRGGGGAQNLSLPPGASYPRYATALPGPQ